MFRTRVISSVVLVILALVTILGGGYLLAATLLFLALVAYRELMKACKLSGEGKKLSALEINGYIGILAYYLVMVFVPDRIYLFLAVDSRVNDFNSSIRFDQRMIAQDMRGSGVHAAMLARQGIISEQDCADILSGLASIADDLSSGALTIDPAAEDVHTFVEQTLTARIGDHLNRGEISAVIQ